MKKLQEAAHAVCEVGRFYLVPCLQVVHDGVPSVYADKAGFVPVLGPKHEDSEHLNFPYQHFHIDWRFATQRAFRHACAFNTSPHGRVITNDSPDRSRSQLTGTPQLLRRRCRRVMPDHPAQTSGRDPGRRWLSLELAQTFTCNKLKPGNICPHRGIDLTPFAKPDGTAICPGHGLRWNLNTGELMPHHTSRGVAA